MSLSIVQYINRYGILARVHFEKFPVLLNGVFHGVGRRGGRGVSEIFGLGIKTSQSQDFST